MAIPTHPFKLTTSSNSLSLSVTCLQCYTDVEARQVTTCNELEGFKTCFTKFNDSKRTLPNHRSIINSLSTRRA